VSQLKFSRDGMSSSRDRPSGMALSIRQLHAAAIRTVQPFLLLANCKVFIRNTPNLHVEHS
jgi:hypothetical protein